MHLNTTVIEKFYTSFSRRNHTDMVVCYAPTIDFSDPVFTL